MHLAIANGDAASLHALLQGKADMSKRYKTFLDVAVEQKALKAAHVLLDAGFYETTNYFTVTRFVVERGDLEMIWHLVQSNMYGRLSLPQKNEVLSIAAARPKGAAVTSLLSITLQ